MCKYCEGKTSIYRDRKNDWIREVYIELEGSLTVTPANVDIYDNCKDINLKINYCPMCGNKVG